MGPKKPVQEKLAETIRKNQQGGKNIMKELDQIYAPKPTKKK